MRATWKPHEKHGDLTMRSDLPSSVYAFPKQRKEPLTDARHVRNAVARFDQVTDVSEDERAQAFANIKKAAKHYGIDLGEESWKDLGAHPQPNRKASSRRGAATRKRTGSAKKAAKKAAATRKRTGVAKKAAKKAAATRKKSRRKSS
ncbi:MAG TPA: DUF6582 domain-containing protein [Candidatus Acidoferrales bacterium]|nr:DUF6582 domain-containing protein [Candidatus Acidoferrales bacterium]